MRRSYVRLLCATLALALLLPAAAIAAPGKSKDGKGGKAAAAARKAARASEVSEETTGSAGAGRLEGKAAKAEEKAARKAAKAEEKAARQAALRQRQAERAGLQALESSPSADASPAPGAERPRGVENALSRIARNLERMQERVDAGLRKQLPPGLLQVVDKFMAWLGIVPGAGETPDDGVPGSDETSPTVPPSGDGTSTVPPSEDGTSTVPPSEETSPAL
ncbi:MAG: hypothetical protein IBX62_07430 [Coriobacteriia bacterium]|nr:hypothetical protein [Coriobacteriia bacterium]